MKTFGKFICAKNREACLIFETVVKVDGTLNVSVQEPISVLAAVTVELSLPGMVTG